MATHEILWPELQAAIAGEKVKPRGAVQGSLNYLEMSLATSLIADPTPARQHEWLDLLDRQVLEGHHARRGPKGVACEQGSPAMHWSFSVASVAGVLQWAIKTGHMEIAAACHDWLIDEVGLNRPFRAPGTDTYALPCPRVKNEKHEAPIDGYRDTFMALALGEPVKRAPKYWAQPNATAVRVMRDLMAQHPEWSGRFRVAPMPKLYLPIQRRDLDGGGFEAWIERTPEAEAAMGHDTCNAVRCEPGRPVVFATDWEGLAA